MEDFLNLSGKTAIVTGASSGIGRATAEVLAEVGANVTLAARRIEKLKELALEIEKMGQKALPVKMDVTKKEEIENMVKETLKKFGKIDILVNNAGIAVFKPFLELSEEDWDQTLDVNLKGQFLVAQAVAKEMVKQKSGKIINIASIASGQVGIGFSNIVHYCASKGGVVAFTEALAVELAPYNIKVNAVAPGIIESEMTGEIIANQKMLEGFLSRIPLKRIGKPEEVGYLIAFLASDKSDYCTGATFYIDGGWLAG